MTAIAAPASPAPRDDRSVQAGDMVRYAGATAQITRIAPDGSADLMSYIDGRPRFTPNVERGHRPDQWITEKEFQDGRPRTPLEIVAETLARGERAPEVGLWVRVAHNVAPRTIHGMQPCLHIKPCRGKIRTVYSMDSIDVDVYAVDPPEDPIQPDLPYEINMRSSHVSVCNAHQSKLGFRQSWCYEDEGLIKEFGGPDVQIEDIIPPYGCDVCHKRVKRITPVFIGRQPVANDPYGHQPPDKNACPDCISDLKQLLGIEDPPKLIPVVGPDPYADDEDFEASAIVELNHA